MSLKEYSASKLKNHQSVSGAEVGIYKRKQESKNERKHATTKNATKKKKEKMITVKKKRKKTRSPQRK